MRLRELLRDVAGPDRAADRTRDKRDGLLDAAPAVASGPEPGTTPGRIEEAAIEPGGCGTVHPRHRTRERAEAGVAGAGQVTSGGHGVH
jgi:hypothetical protein